MFCRLTTTLRLMTVQDIVKGSGNLDQITKIEKSLIQVYRAIGRHGEANEAERRLGTLLEDLSSPREDDFQCGG